MLHLFLKVKSNNHYLHRPSPDLIVIQIPFPFCPYFCIMKTLILVRHAKSSWDEIGLPDSERPLNERGKKDAPEMAKRLKKKDDRPVYLEPGKKSPSYRSIFC
jgi:hypothetical protein